jgi:hypothetical protein
MKKYFRPRNLFMVGGTLAILAYLITTDPVGGAGLTLTFLAQLATPVIAVWFAHLARKALFDYLDMGEIFNKAKQTATGAGLTFLGICIVIFGLLSLFGSQVYAQDVKTYIPQGAYQHVPTVKQEQARLWADNPKPGSLLA